MIYDHLDCSTEQVYSCEEEAEINYGYVVMIAIAIGILLLAELKRLGQKMYVQFCQEEEEEDTYVTMDQVQL